MSKDLKKIILIASSLLALIIISLIIIISINREEPNPSDEPSEQAGSNTETKLQPSDSGINHENSKADNHSSNDNHNEDNISKNNDNQENNKPTDNHNDNVLAEGISFEVENHKYKVISSSNKSVALISTSQQGGDFIVPSQVTYNNVTYIVTEVGGPYEMEEVFDADESSYSTFYTGAFTDNNFTSVTIPKSIKKISDYSFCSMQNLKIFTLYGDDIVIGKYALHDISSISNDCNVEIKANKVILEERALSNTLFVKSININADELIIGDYALASSSEGLKLPEGTTYIGNYAFDSSVGTLTIPKNVSYIGEGAFNKMKLDIDKDNKHFKIDDGVLYTIDGTQIIRAFDVSGPFTIPSEVTTIMPYAFAYSNITEITSSENMKVIPDYAFYNCTKLKKVTLLEGIQSIGDWAFAGRSKISQVSLPKSLITIGDRAFYYNDNLKSIQLPNNLASIGERAFYHTGISEVRIPATVSAIGREAFFCRDLESPSGVSISINEDNPYFEQIGNIVYRKGSSDILMIILDSNSDTISLPSGIKDLNDINFINFDVSMSLVIPDTVTNIDCKIFSYFNDVEETGVVYFNTSKAPALKLDDSYTFHIYVIAPDDADRDNYEKAFSIIPDRKVQYVRFAWDN
ncbi:MAG: leucine-rich repeat domain-containing protein [Bacillota bacterium]|jgi:hypothetical protein|nr:leucine-rich repeat domain-containing protein [Bacillota bacterium]